MWNLVGELTAGGVTVLLTTQYLEEADRLADRIAVIDRGAIVAQGTAAELKATVAGQRLDLTLADDAAYAEVHARLGERAVTRDPLGAHARGGHRRQRRRRARAAGRTRSRRRR